MRNPLIKYSKMLMNMQISSLNIRKCLLICEISEAKGAEPSSFCILNEGKMNINGVQNWAETTNFCPTNEENLHIQQLFNFYIFNKELCILNTL